MNAAPIRSPRLVRWWARWPRPGCDRRDRHQRPRGKFTCCHCHLGVLLILRCTFACSSSCSASACPRRGYIMRRSARAVLRGLFDLPVMRCLCSSVLRLPVRPLRRRRVANFGPAPSPRQPHVAGPYAVISHRRLHPAVLFIFIGPDHGAARSTSDASVFSIRDGPSFDRFPCYLGTRTFVCRAARLFICR